MSGQKRMQGQIGLALVAGLLMVITPALARSQGTQQPTPAPADPPTTNAKDGKEDKNKAGETVGKSKLERETGTINDRIFEVLPNYGTVENAQARPPLTTGQKFRLATSGSFISTATQRAII